MNEPKPEYYPRLVPRITRDGEFRDCCSMICPYYGHFCARYKKRLELVQTRTGNIFTGDAERIKLQECH